MGYHAGKPIESVVYCLSKLNEDSEDAWQIIWTMTILGICCHVVNDSLFLTFLQTILHHILVNVSDVIGWTNLQL